MVLADTADEDISAECGEARVKGALCGQRRAGGSSIPCPGKGRPGRY